MADEDSARPTESERQEEEEEEQEDEQNEQDPYAEKSSSDDSESEYDSEDSYFTDYSDEETLTYTRLGEEPPESENTPEINIRRFTRVLDSRHLKKKQDEEDQSVVYQEDLFDFPEDPENWKEEDLKELWADAPLAMTKPGWDPAWADEDDMEVVNEEIEAGRDPQIAPFYVPYRKPYPVIPDNHHDIENPKGVIEELDRIEEFLTWVSYVFPDGSSYVFDFMRYSSLFFGIWLVHCMYNVVGWVWLVCFYGLCDISRAGVCCISSYSYFVSFSFFWIWWYFVCVVWAFVDCLVVHSNISKIT